MPTASYAEDRARLETYFDRTAREAWTRLTSDAPVSGVRATVRAGRDRMRSLLLSWLPQDLSGARVLDAGCGAGQMTAALAERGASVVAVDVSAGLIEVARDRLPADLRGRVEFVVGDMLDPSLGVFDYTLAMDSLIHYRSRDVAAALSRLSERATRAIAFTFAPRTPALAVMHALGKLFPRGDRAPAIAPVSERELRHLLRAHVRSMQAARSAGVMSGFYASTAMELVAS